MGTTKRCLISRDEIARRVAELAEQIGRDYAGRDLVMVGVLKGVFIFLADLVRALPFPVEVDFVRLCSYGAGTSHQRGSPHHQGCGRCPCKDRDVLIVEDIVDIGLTLDFLRQHLAQPPAPLPQDLLPHRQARTPGGGSPPGLHRLCGGKGLPGGLRPGLRRTEPHPAGNFCVGEGLRAEKRSSALQASA